LRTLTKKKVITRREYVPDVSVWIALNLFYKRRAASLTQGQLAKKAGVSFRRYQTIETAATANVTVKTLSALAKALGLQVRDLLKPRKDYVRV
jgi:transcriptional regulator with XRE-family HTH domain